MWIAACCCATGGAPGPAVEPYGEDILAGDNQEWEYSMRRGMQEVIDGVFLGPYAVARKNNVGSAPAPSYPARSARMLVLCSSGRSLRGVPQLAALEEAGITHIVCVRQEAEAL